MTAVSIMIGVAIFAALATGLVAAAVEAGVDLHQMARLLAHKTSSAARRMAIATGLNSSAIAQRVVAMCRYEIRELSRAATSDRVAAAAQEQKLRDACLDVAAKVATDARRA